MTDPTLVATAWMDAAWDDAAAPSRSDGTPT